MVNSEAFVPVIEMVPMERVAVPLLLTVIVLGVDEEPVFTAPKEIDVGDTDRIATGTGEP